MKVYRHIRNAVNCLGMGGAVKYRIALELKKQNIPLLNNKLWKFKAKKRGFEFFIRPYEADIFLIRELILGTNMDGVGEYDITKLDEIFKSSDDVRYIIDAGANIGMFSLLIANKYKNARVVAVEPDENNFEILKKNCELYDNIVCLNLGIWSENCKLKLINPGCGSMSFRFEKTDGSEGTNAICIETLLSSNHFEGVDILKMDIEGSEMEVFSKNNSWIDECRFYMIETHDRYAPDCTEFIDKLLKKKGYLYEKNGENRIYYMV